MKDPQALYESREHSLEGDRSLSGLRQDNIPKDGSPRAWDQILRLPGSGCRLAVQSAGAFSEPQFSHL